MRNSVRRQWQRMRNFCYKTTVNRLEALIKHKIQKLRNMDWNFKLSSIPPSHQNVWKAAKMIKNQTQMPPLNLGSSIALTAEEKSNALADTFQKADENPLANNDPQFTEKVKYTV